MTEEEFQAPDWVKNGEEQKPVTKKQKIGFLITLAVVIPFCLWAGWFELGRAQEGHWRAWVYAFEWPFFAVVSIYLYRRLMRGDLPKISQLNLDKLKPKLEDEDK